MNREGTSEPCLDHYLWEVRSSTILHFPAQLAYFQEGIVGAPKQTIAALRAQALLHI